MRGFWLFLHYLGFILWLGAGIATMVAGVASKRLANEDRLVVYRITGLVQRVIVGPGAMLVIFSGLALAMAVMKSGVVPGYLNLMMGAGLLGALFSVGIAVPAAARLGRLELDARGELPEVFTDLRKRVIWSASAGGGLGLIALGAATIGRF